MNDSEIIKALKCCHKTYNDICFKYECPLFGQNNCCEKLHSSVLELIEHDKSEIEQLRKPIERVLADACRQTVKSLVHKFDKELHQIHIDSEVNRNPNTHDTIMNKLVELAIELVGE